MVTGQSLVPTFCGCIGQCWTHSDNTTSCWQSFKKCHAWKNETSWWVSKSVKAAQLHFRVKPLRNRLRESWKQCRRLDRPRGVQIMQQFFVRNLPWVSCLESWGCFCIVLLNEQDGRWSAKQYYQVHSLWNLWLTFLDKHLVFKTKKPYSMSHHLVKSILSRC